MSDKRAMKAKGGYRPGLELYVRSQWEANFGFYLRFLKSHGDILTWAYESEEFEFPVKRGSRFYKPDFTVTENDGALVRYEVKGYMDPTSATKLKRMGKYFPEVGVKVIDSDWFKSMRISGLARIIEGWE